MNEEAAVKQLLETDNYLDFMSVLTDYIKSTNNYGKEVEPDKSGYRSGIRQMISNQNSIVWTLKRLKLNYPEIKSHAKELYDYVNPTDSI